MSYTLSHLAFFFIIYSTIGWCGEVMLATYNQRKFVNRGFLNGPVCPIYGVGGNVVILCLTPFMESLPALFFGSMLLTTVLELVVGWTLEKYFHQKWWDYDKEVLNFKGYICIRFSIIWGVACTLVMKVLHPAVMKLYEKIPAEALPPLYAAYYSIFAVDLIITVADLAKIRAIVVATNDLDHILNKVSEMVGKGLSDGTLKTLESYDRQKERFEAQIEKMGLPDVIEAGKNKLAAGKDKLMAGLENLTSPKGEPGAAEFGHIHSWNWIVGEKVKRMAGWKGFIALRDGFSKDRTEELHDEALREEALERCLDELADEGAPLSKGEGFETEKGRMAAFKAKCEEIYDRTLGRLTRRFGKDYEEGQPRLSFVQRRMAKAYPNLNIDVAGNLNRRFKRLRDWAARVKNLFDRDDAA
ncbi:MAG: hypothetical protein K6G81_11500 [Lachnospiraceae bacterium]|nr:hypothetical protein [Lachnospiraceae bacterium]